MPGIVACEALYNLVERYAPDATVRYLPAELHEFPVNVPLEDAIVDRVRGAIEDLDALGLDRIVVSYALEDGADRLSATHASLVVSDATDCISTVLPETTRSYGENKVRGTLYLTRGWVDCGVDSYKLYRTYRDELDGLLAEFEAASDRHPNLRYTWHQGDRFERARSRPSAASPDLAEEFFRSIVEHYDRVALVDTGDLYDLHYEYARQTRDFIERLSTSDTADAEVALTTIDGDVDAFRTLLQGTRSVESE